MFIGAAIWAAILVVGGLYVWNNSSNPSVYFMFASGALAVSCVLLLCGMGRGESAGSTESSAELGSMKMEDTGPLPGYSVNQEGKLVHKWGLDDHGRGL